jgi:WD40 repeat protein
MNHDDSKQIILQLLQQKGKATNKEMIRLVGNEELFEEIRQELILDDLARDKAGVGLEYIGTSTDKVTQLKDLPNEIHQQLASEGMKEFYKSSRKNACMVMSRYYIAHLPTHLIAAECWDDLERLLTDITFLESKVAAGMGFELISDFNAAIEHFPEEIIWAGPLLHWEEFRRPPEGYSTKKIFKLLEEALQRDLHFIANHINDYSQAFFQSLWNTCWWYDNPVTVNHYTPPDEGWPEGGPPWKRTGYKFYSLLEKWLREKSRRRTDNVSGEEKLIDGQKPLHWLRSKRPPIVPLGAGQAVKLVGHTGKIMSAVFSPDGKRILSGSSDNSVRIWDAKTGEQLVQINGHTNRVNSVSYSPDGKRIVTGADDNSIRVWDNESEKQLFKIIGHTTFVNCVAFSPDGKRIVSGGGDNIIRIWNADTGEQLSQLTGHTGWINGVTFHPEGKRIASVSADGSVRTWIIENEEQIAQYSGHTNKVNNVSFSPDGKLLVTGSDDKTVYLWNTETGKQLLQFTGHTAKIMDVAFSPDGKRIVSGSKDRTVRVWDTDSGEQLTQYTGHTDGVNSVSFSLDGQRIVSGAGDNTYGKEDKIVRVWDAINKEPHGQLIGHTDTINNVLFNHDGSRIVSMSADNSVRVWDTESGNHVSQLYGSIGSFSNATFSPNGKRIAILSGSHGLIWDTESGELIAHNIRHDDCVSSIAFSPDSTRIVTGDFDRYDYDDHKNPTFRIWDVETGKQVAQLEGSVVFLSVQLAFSPDGTKVVNDYGMKTRVWDAETGERLEVSEDALDYRIKSEEPVSYPYRLVNRNSKTALECTTCDDPTAWYPEVFSCFSTHTSGRQWTAVNDKHITILELVGDIFS